MSSDNSKWGLILGGFAILGLIFGFGPLKGLQKCSCSEEEPAYYNHGRSNPSFKNNADKKYLRTVQTFRSINGSWKKTGSVELWKNNDTRKLFVIKRGSSYPVIDSGNNYYDYCFYDEWGYCFYFD